MSKLFHFFTCFKLKQEYNDDGDVEWKRTFSDDGNTEFYRSFNDGAVEWKRTFGDDSNDELKQRFNNDGDADTSRLLPDPEATVVEPSYSLHYQTDSLVKTVDINPLLVKQLQDTIDDFPVDFPTFSSSDVKHFADVEIATFATSKQGSPHVKEILSASGALQYGILFKEASLFPRNPQF